MYFYIASTQTLQSGKFFQNKIDFSVSAFVIILFDLFMYFFFQVERPFWMAMVTK